MLIQTKKWQEDPLWVWAAFCAGIVNVASPMIGSIYGTESSSASLTATLVMLYLLVFYAVVTYFLFGLWSFCAFFQLCNENNKEKRVPGYKKDLEETPGETLVLKSATAGSIMLAIAYILIILAEGDMDWMILFMGIAIVLSIFIAIAIVLCVIIWIILEDRKEAKKRKP